MNYKETNTDAYNAYSNRYEERTIVCEWIADDLNKFFENLCGFRILDAGAGPGRDSGYLRKMGGRCYQFGLVCRNAEAMQK
ncbi:hypothetical protein HYT56_04175 [Candidatus Woesearchaeota archaeon]|nr:hypothetical protein [Candidatus Woesearchaeota archaeon]